MRRRKKVETEIFVCDNCGARARLSSSVRHWCADCKIAGAPVEMRSVRDKRKRLPEHAAR